MYMPKNKKELAWLLLAFFAWEKKQLRNILSYICIADGGGSLMIASSFSCNIRLDPLTYAYFLHYRFIYGKFIRDSSTYSLLKIFFFEQLFKIFTNYLSNILYGAKVLLLQFNYKRMCVELRGPPGETDELNLV